MPRSTEEIKREITSAWMADDNLRAIYGFDEGTEFNAFFSKVSIENLICHIVAAAIGVHERIFQKHDEEVRQYISLMKPHTLRWYVSMAKAFQAGRPLIPGEDHCDNAGVDPTVVDSERVVRFAAASEKAATIYIKVAGEKDGKKQPISLEQQNGLVAYFAEIKDAGVQVKIINQNPDMLFINADIYFDPMVLNDKGVNLLSGKTPALEAALNYISNLPFNGEYSNQALVDALQNAEGVRLVEFNGAQTQSFSATAPVQVNARHKPESGYYDVERSVINLKYIPYTELEYEP